MMVSTMLRGTDGEKPIMFYCIEIPVNGLNREEKTSKNLGSTYRGNLVPRRISESSSKEKSC